MLESGKSVLVNDCMFWRVERKRRPASLSEIFMPVVTMKLVPRFATVEYLDLE